MQWGDRARAKQERTEKVQGMIWKTDKRGAEKATNDFLPQKLKNKCLGRSPRCQSPGIVPFPDALCSSPESCLEGVTQSGGLTCSIKRGTSISLLVITCHQIGLLFRTRQM